jgi:hypothetical protein
MRRTQRSLSLVPVDFIQQTNSFNGSLLSAVLLVLLCKIHLVTYNKPNSITLSLGLKHKQQTG